MIRIDVCDEEYGLEWKKRGWLFLIYMHKFMNELLILFNVIDVTSYFYATYEEITCS